MHLLPSPPGEGKLNPSWHTYIPSPTGEGIYVCHDSHMPEKKFRKKVSYGPPNKTMKKWLTAPKNHKNKFFSKIFYRNRILRPRLQVAPLFPKNKIFFFGGGQTKRSKNGHFLKNDPYRRSLKIAQKMFFSKQKNTSYLF